MKNRKLLHKVKCHLPENQLTVGLTVVPLKDSIKSAPEKNQTSGRLPNREGSRGLHLLTDPAGKGFWKRQWEELRWTPLPRLVGAAEGSITKGPAESLQHKCPPAPSLGAY